MLYKMVDAEVLKVIAECIQYLLNTMTIDGVYHFLQLTRRIPKYETIVSTSGSFKEANVDVAGAPLSISFPLKEWNCRILTSRMFLNGFGDVGFWHSAYPEACYAHRT